MSLQAQFAHALLDPGAACPPGIRSWNGSDPATRFAVYRNNVVASLIDALADGFPVTQELVGEEFFRAMARVHALAQPPRSRLMAFFGARFPDFIQSFAPVAQLPYLGDVARLEMLRVRAYHAADATALTPDAIATAWSKAQQLDRLCVGLHPSVYVLRSRFAAFSLWAAHQGALDIGEVDPGVAQDMLVFRSDLDVDTLQLCAGSASFIAALQSGQTLARAVAAVQDPAFDLAGAMALLIRHQLITCLEAPTSCAHRPETCSGTGAARLPCLRAQ